MRLIVKDYLQTLKEKDELDLLLCDVLRQDGFVIDSVPRTGNRQYGVDILAHNKTDVFLLVVKQGNIDRKIWDNDQNSVRQSLDEIFDVSLRNLSPSDQKKKISIIVATNGFLDEAIRLNWQGYQDNHSKWNGKKVRFDFWGIDEITLQVQQKLFSEHLFPLEMQSALRKALYFIEEPDYKNTYFENIIDTYINKLPVPFSLRVKKDAQKILSSLMLAVEMIAHYAASTRKYKISVLIFEYIIVRFWKWMLQNNGMEKAFCSEWIIKFYKKYDDYSQQYYEAIKDCCTDVDTFPAYSNVVEQKIKIYEVVGQLSSYAYGKCLFDPQRANEILDTVLMLINHNPQFYYAPYDENISCISLLCRAFIACGRKDAAIGLIENLSLLVSNWFVMLKKYPTPADSFRDAINIELGNPHEEYETSAFWGFILLWTAVLNEKSNYDSIKNFLNKDLKDVTKCIWVLRENEELSLYDKHAMFSAGEGIALHVPDDYDKFHESMQFLLNQYSAELFSYQKYSFPALEMIASHYYGSIPRVVSD